MITRPLNLDAHLRPPLRTMDWAFWVNGGLIVLLFSLFGSRFVLAPGLAIDLPKTDAATLTAAITNEVISVPRANAILFQDALCDLPQFKTRLAEHAKGRQDLSLLVRPNRHVESQDLMAIVQAAQAAGYRVLIAAEPASPEPASGARRR